MIKHGNPGASKMTVEQVLSARRRYAAGGVTQEALAREFGLSIGAMRNLLRGVTWQHLNAPPLAVPASDAEKSLAGLLDALDALGSKDQSTDSIDVSKYTGEK